MEGGVGSEQRERGLTSTEWCIRRVNALIGGTAGCRRHLGKLVRRSSSGIPRLRRGGRGIDGLLGCSNRGRYPVPRVGLVGTKTTGHIGSGVHVRGLRVLVGGVCAVQSSGGLCVGTRVPGVRLGRLGGRLLEAVAATTGGSIGLLRVVASSTSVPRSARARIPRTIKRSVTVRIRLEGTFGRPVMLARLVRLGKTVLYYG